MKVCLEILESAFINDAEKIQDLNEKELVPKMMMRRRLTRAAKILIYLSDACKFTQGKVVFGSAYGELDVTASIIHSIDKNEAISPTAFQNSVYNTAASYFSILHKNIAEVLTVSSSDQTSLDVLRNAALLALNGDEILLVAIETINTLGIDEVNTCGANLECGVAMKVKLSIQTPSILEYHDNANIPKSLDDMVTLHKCFEAGQNIIEVEL